MKETVMEGELFFVLLFEAQNGFDIYCGLVKAGACFANRARSS
jgi:UDP-N-acetylmuramyl pentapeptide synthase